MSEARTLDASAPGETGVRLADHTTLRLGGTARRFVEASTQAELLDVIAAADAVGEPVLVLAGGSNLVISDDGFDGLVAKIATRGIQADNELRPGDATCGGVLVTVAAGEPWDAFVAHAVERGWVGIEALSGIPGAVGSTPIQNVGAYGQEVASIVEAVRAFDGDTGEMVELDAAGCGFSYRHSRFKGEDAGRFVICGVRFRLTRGAPTLTYPDVQRWLGAHGLASPALGDVRSAVLAIRRSKGMVADGVDPDARSVGSFFMNPVIAATDRERLAARTGQDVPARTVAGGRVRVPAAWLIERAGWARGAGEGPVGISPKHPLAIVNRGGARAADIIEFAARVKRRVADRLGVWLQPEPVFVGFDGAAELPDLEYLRKAHP